jgi:hypothetical protein
MRKRSDAPKRKRQSVAVAPRVITKLSKRAKRGDEAGPSARLDADSPAAAEPQLSGASEVSSTGQELPLLKLLASSPLSKTTARRTSSRCEHSLDIKYRQISVLHKACFAASC